MWLQGTSFQGPEGASGLREWEPDAPWRGNGPYRELQSCQRRGRPTATARAARGLTDLAWERVRASLGVPREGHTATDKVKLTGSHLSSSPAPSMRSISGAAAERNPEKGSARDQAGLPDCSRFFTS